MCVRQDVESGARARGERSRSCTSSARSACSTPRRARSATPPGPSSSWSRARPARSGPAQAEGSLDDSSHARLRYWGTSALTHGGSSVLVGSCSWRSSPRRSIAHRAPRCGGDSRARVARGRVILKVFRERLSIRLVTVALDGRAMRAAAWAARMAARRAHATWRPSNGAPPLRHRAAPLRRSGHVPQIRSSHLRIAHLTDLHVGRITPFEVQRTAVEMTNAEKPDLVLLSGDFVCHSQLYLDQLTEVIRAVPGAGDRRARQPRLLVGRRRGPPARSSTAASRCCATATRPSRCAHERLQVVGLDDAYTGPRAPRRGGQRAAQGPADASRCRTSPRRPTACGGTASRWFCRGTRTAAR